MLLHINVSLSIIGVTRSRNLYKKLAPLNVTKIVQLDWSAVFGSFWYQKLAQRSIYSVQISGTIFLSTFP